MYYIVRQAREVFMADYEEARNSNKDKYKKYTPKHNFERGPSCSKCDGCLECPNDADDVCMICNLCDDCPYESADEEEEYYALNQNRD